MRRRKNFESESPVEEEDDDDKDEDDDDDDDKKSTSKNPESKSSLPKIFIFCLIARIINSLLVQTYFNPDEHWQALEIAHRIAFGYGHQTWEWEKGIRSYLHPVIFAALYKVLAFLHLDSPWFMIRSPRLLQSIFAAFGDLYVYKFSRVLFGGSVAEWAFNFFSSGGDYYGTHAWHWYLTQGFTVMLFTYIPFTIAGIIMSKEWKLPGLVVWVLGIYSLLGHKEFRFVLPVLPVALMFSGYSLASLGRAERSKGGSYSHIRRAPKLELAVLFLLVTNVPMALYMSMIHQRGTEDLMNYLAEEATENNVESILFLTPCHATPYYSTLHRNLPMRFLDCTPSDDRGILDESDQFLKDPIGFTTKLAQTWNRPSHIALFDSEEKPLKGFLASHHFKEIKRFFHSHFKVDRELQASVVLYAFQGH